MMDIKSLRSWQEIQHSGEVHSRPFSVLGHTYLRSKVAAIDGASCDGDGVTFTWKFTFEKLGRPFVRHYLGLRCRPLLWALASRFRMRRAFETVQLALHAVFRPTRANTRRW